MQRITNGPDPLNVFLYWELFWELVRRWRHSWSPFFHKCGRRADAATFALSDIQLGSNHACPTGWAGKGVPVRARTWAFSLLFSRVKNLWWVSGTWGQWRCNPQTLNNAKPCCHFTLTQDICLFAITQCGLLACTREGRSVSFCLSQLRSSMATWLPILEEGCGRECSQPKVQWKGAPSCSSLRDFLL